VTHTFSLLSDQVDEREVRVVLRELEKALESGVPGDAVEFGCYVGTTSVFLAKRLKGTDRQLYLYDSFEGLPPKTSEDESPAGLQFKTGELLATKKQLIKNLRQANVPMPIIKKGWFSDLSENDVPETIGFAFLDGDYYHSVRDPLKLIWNHLAPGAIIVIDDYANEALPGAAKAVDEWLLSHQGRLRVEHSLGIIHT
jgi:O-methyltransferase